MKFVAIGDSFTEGVGDEDESRPRGIRGWADRVAEQIGLAEPGSQYANLSVRGKLMDQILDDQVERALELKPDLLTCYAGGNDLMRKSPNIDAMIVRYRDALARFTDAGIRTVIWTSTDPVWSSGFRPIRGRAAVYNEMVREVAEELELELIDFWRLREYHDYRMWAWDRIHMATPGHENMAYRVLEKLGIPTTLSPVDLGPVPDLSRAERRTIDQRWRREFVYPWISRRVRGVSSGDGLLPRFPEYVPAESV